jgi:hypothetical protein
MASEHAVSYEDYDTHHSILDLSVDRSRTEFTSNDAVKADIALALKHQQARMIRNLDGIKIADPSLSRCKCCKLPEVRVRQTAPLFSLGCDTLSLKQLGPGVPLYFSFVRYVCCILATGSLAVSAACIAYNVIQNHSEDWISDGSLFIRCSVGNNGDPHKREDVIPMWQSILHCCFVGLIVLSYHLYWTKHHSRLTVEIDKSIVSPSDYTVWLKGLGSSFESCEITELMSSAVKVEVVKVNIPTDIWHYDQAKRQMLGLQRRLNKRDKCCCRRESLTDLSLQLVKVKKEYDSIGLQLTSDSSATARIGQAFVTFRFQKDMRAVLSRWARRSWWTRLFNQVDPLRFKEFEVSVSRAAEPDDILWENLNTKISQHLKYRLRTVLITFLALVVSFSLIFSTSYYQSDLLVDSSKQTDNFTTALIQVSSFFPSIGVILINVVLGQVIRKLTAFEFQSTLSEHHASVAVKLTGALCVNTGLIVLIVNYDWRKSWFVPGGLVTDVTYIMLSNAVLTPLASLFNPSYLGRLWSRRFGSSTLTQTEANLIFEGPLMDLAKKYADTLKTLTVALAFCPVAPVCLPIALCGMVLDYWTDKYLLLRRYSRPGRVSHSLSQILTGTLPTIVLIYAASNFFFISKLNPDDSLPALITLTALGIYYFVPIEILRLQKTSTIIEVEEDDPPYEEANLGFINVRDRQDYDRCNPVTARKGWNDYFIVIDQEAVTSGFDIAAFKEHFTRKHIHSQLHEIVTRPQLSIDLLSRERDIANRNFRIALIKIQAITALNRGRNRRRSIVSLSNLFQTSTIEALSTPDDEEMSVRPFASSLH